MEAKTDYQKKMEELISALPETEHPRLLMHSCCAPCTSAVLERVVPRFDVTLLYFNPNIMPRSEYERRAAEYPKLLRAAGLESAVDIIYCDYDDSVYLAAVKGLDNEPEGGPRCTVCYGLRLTETAKRAAEGGFMSRGCLALCALCDAPEEALRYLETAETLTGGLHRLEDYTK